MRKKLYFGLILILSGWLLTAHAMATEAGWINDFDGSPENYMIKRGDETVPVAVFMVLQVGDEISLKQGPHPITLSLRGGTQTVEVTPENSPYQVDAQSQVPEELTELWAWTKQRLSEWRELTQSLISGESSDAEPPHDIVMPLLENVNHPAHLIAGERPLHLQWYGGQPSYTVHIKQRRKFLLTQKSFTTAIETEKMAFNVRPNKPYQSYRVIVRDTEDQMFIGGFRVVSTAPDMTKPTALETMKLPADFLKTVQAAWLATQEEGKWIFEAYQQAAELPGYRPAILLKEVLARGKEKQVRRGIRG
ncbi:MAG: hypothetical protein VSS75_032600 [Candidatus Parabeggiatoa sp.]|nr:hypothetical protein [Candidatus Parabeggiatoa sp.]